MDVKSVGLCRALVIIVLARRHTSSRYPCEDANPTPTAHLQPATQQLRNHLHLYIGIQTSCDGCTGRPTMHPSPWVLCPPFAHAYKRYDISLMACAICTGPVLLRRENIKNIDDLQIETWVNDVLVQVGNASGVKTRTGMPPSHARLT